MRVAFAIVLATCMTAEACAQVRQPDRLRSLITRALTPAPGESVVIERDSMVRSLVAPIVFVGRREPPIGSGEDPRPAAAAVFISVSDTVVVARLHHVPRVWLLLRQQTLDSVTVVSEILTILDVSRIVPSQRVFRSAVDSASFPYAALLRNRSVLPLIAAPSAQRRGEGYRVTVFADNRAGIDKYSFSIRGGTLRVSVSRLSGYRGAF